jgi:hypothetical protein
VKLIEILWLSVARKIAHREPQSEHRVQQRYKTILIIEFSGCNPIKEVR